MTSCGCVSDMLLLHGPGGNGPIEGCPDPAFLGLLRLPPGGAWSLGVVSVAGRWHEVDVGFDFLEFCETTGAAQAA